VGDTDYALIDIEEDDITTDEALPKAVEVTATGDRHPLWRRILALLLAVLAIVAVVLSLLVGWEKRVFADEDQFVATFAELPSNDAVATTLSIRIADRIVERSGVNDFVVGVLPDPLGFLALPLTSTISGSIADITYGVVSSDGFSAVWEITLRATHRSVTAILSGGGDVLSTDEGSVAIDLDAIAGQVVASVESRGISLPNLDIEFGEIVLYESEQLAGAQSIASTIDKLGWFVPLVALLLITATLLTASDRRKMVSFLGFGTAVAVLITLAGVRTGQFAIVGRIEDETSREAGVFVWSTLTELFVQAAWALFALCVVIGFVAWVRGPSRHAKSLAGWTRSTIDHWGDADGSEPSAASEFFTQWKRVVDVGIVILASLFVMVGPAPTGFSVLATVVIAGALIGAVEIVSGPTHQAEDTVNVDADSSV
jgi:hypothetical protein